VKFFRNYFDFHFQTESRNQYEELFSHMNKKAMRVKFCNRMVIREIHGVSPFKKSSISDALPHSFIPKFSENSR
jgi:hypothetical protein